MNDFGIRSAIRACMMVYEGASRGSGRTTRTINEMREEDIFVARSHKMARQVQGMARRMGKNIKVHTISENAKTVSDIRYELSKIMHGRPTENRGIFLDHHLVYFIYETAADDVQRFLTEATKHQPDDLEHTDPYLARPIRMDYAPDLGPPYR